MTTIGSYIPPVKRGALPATPSMNAKPHAKALQFGSGYGGYEGSDNNFNAPPSPHPSSTYAGSLIGGPYTESLIGGPYAGSHTDTYAASSVTSTEQPSYSTTRDEVAAAQRHAKNTARAARKTEKRETAEYEEAMATQRANERREREQRAKLNKDTGYDVSPNTSSASSNRNTPTPPPASSSKKRSTRETIKDAYGDLHENVKTLRRSRSERHLQVQDGAGKKKWITLWR